MRWEVRGPGLLGCGAGFYLEDGGSTRTPRQTMVGKGDRDPTLACEGGLGGVMSQLSEEGMPGPRLHPQQRFSEQVFSGEMTQGERGKTRRLKRAKCLLGVGEAGSLLMHREKRSWVALLYPDLLLLMEPSLSLPHPSRAMAPFACSWEPFGDLAFTTSLPRLLGCREAPWVLVYPSRRGLVWVHCGAHWAPISWLGQWV